MAEVSWRMKGSQSHTKLSNPGVLGCEEFSQHLAMKISGKLLVQICEMEGSWKETQKPSYKAHT